MAGRLDQAAIDSPTETDPFHTLDRLTFKYGLAEAEGVLVANETAMLEIDETLAYRRTIGR